MCAWNPESSISLHALHCASHFHYVRYLYMRMYLFIINVKADEYALNLVLRRCRCFPSSALVVPVPLPMQSLQRFRRRRSMRSSSAKNYLLLSRVHTTDNGRPSQVLLYGPKSRFNDEHCNRWILCGKASSSIVFDWNKFFISLVLLQYLFDRSMLSTSDECISKIQNAEKTPQCSAGLLLPTIRLAVRPFRHFLCRRLAECRIGFNYCINCRHLFAGGISFCLCYWRRAYREHI